MFDRVTIRATDREASERFYGVVLRTLGDEQSRTDARDARWADFTVRQADERHPATRNLHVGFVADTRSRVDEFWRTGTHAGYRDDGAPGPRPEYGDDYYGGFLLDPDGNSAEAVHHETLRRGGIVDHLWIRVADVGVSKHFHETLAPHAGLRLKDEAPDHAQFAGESGLVLRPRRHADRAPPHGLRGRQRRRRGRLPPRGHRGGLPQPGVARPSGSRTTRGRTPRRSQDPDGHHIELVHHGR